MSANWNIFKQRNKLLAAELPENPLVYHDLQTRLTTYQNTIDVIPKMTAISPVLDITAGQGPFLTVSNESFVFLELK